MNYRGITILFNALKVAWSSIVGHILCSCALLLMLTEWNGKVISVCSTLLRDFERKFVVTALVLN